MDRVLPIAKLSAQWVENTTVGKTQPSLSPLGVHNHTNSRKFLQNELGCTWGLLPDFPLLEGGSTFWEWETQLHVFSKRSLTHIHLLHEEQSPVQNDPIPSQVGTRQALEQMASWPRIANSLLRLRLVQNDKVRKPDNIVLSVHKNKQKLQNPSHS